MVSSSWVFTAMPLRALYIYTGRGGGGDKVVHEGSSEQGCSAKAKEISGIDLIFACLFPSLL